MKQYSNKKINPLISVIMPVYNGGSYLEQAIDSILNQTYQNFELIIINDNSQDKTAQILNTYQTKYPSKIKIITLKKRQGAFGAANIGIKKAKGEFIAPMDSDDISKPQRLQKQVTYLLENQDVILVGSQAKIINKDGEIIGEKIFPTTHAQIYKKFFEIYPIVHPSCMIRSALLPKKNKLYINKYGVNDDYFTCFSLLKRGEFANLPEYLLYYRIHFKNSSLQNLKQKFYNTVKIRLAAVGKFGYRPTMLGIIKFILQIAIVSVTPQAILFNLYLLIKRIYTLNDIKFNLKVLLIKKANLALRSFL